MTNLQVGQNIALEGDRLDAQVTIAGVPSGMDLDLSAFVLNAQGQVIDDSAFVFYGQPSFQAGAVMLDAAARRVSVQLSALPAAVERVAVAITIDQGMRRAQRFAQLQQLTLEVASGGQACTFGPPLVGMAETALILAEFYRRNGQWKLRAVGQGFTGGLGPLAKHFGVDVADDPDATTAAPASVPPPVPVAPPPLPPPPSVNLSKIVLEKSKPVALEKASGKFGEIVVNLRWSRGGGLFSRAIDLDLGAMVEMQDGDKTVIQALGGNFGSLAQMPYVKLMGDDRSGSSGQGEFLHLNGDEWSRIKRVLIFAFIYEGTPNWSSANGVVTIRTPGQPELEARLDSPNNRDGMCAIAMLENSNGTLRATKQVDYFTGHDTMDLRFGFGFEWRAARK
ncbi:TerD family protein [Xanthomonas campestris pv. campestris]|uniref:TerD family protein n=1 Tax=Xanthomonas campestris TaxID=339 RepID=UPI0020CA040E|nr:TerD family protein [Xanthomonas campestris]MEB1180991.1 TerD family protein [Xanthomonas campestris pv. campestris]MEB1903552.1 TerD family protein [Xanthomonas campestris pv. campestris]MEB2017629.1 TerD family protein [Xanthomonas campestris pv. campestris]